MKKNTTSQSAPIPAQKKNSLFDSILANEGQQDIELICQKYANRVGLVLKILHNREMATLRNNFIGEISNLVQDYCKKIDNELSAIKED